MLLLATLLPSCATVTGTATGAVTGFVDLPNMLIRKHQMKDDAPETWLLAIVMAPVGVALGPALGLVKGIALDVGVIRNQLTLSEEFGTYEAASVWRPFTFGWK